MTDQELIRALRGAATGSLLCRGCGHEYRCNSRGCAIINEAAARLETLTEPPNEALTLEDLRGMDLGEWLWVEVIHPTERQRLRNIQSSYYQIYKDYTDRDAFCCGLPGVIHGFDFEDYGTTWLAYRRKPEEPQPTEICAATGQPCCRCQPGACNSRREEALRNADST